MQQIVSNHLLVALSSLASISILCCGFNQDCNHVKMILKAGGEYRMDLTPRANLHLRLFEGGRFEAELFLNDGIQRRLVGTFEAINGPLNSCEIRFSQLWRVDALDKTVLSSPNEGVTLLAKTVSGALCLLPSADSPLGFCKSP